jgi:hypothetical protein
MDIAKCENNTCELRKECFRYIMPPNRYRQSYGKFEPLNGKCEYFKVVPTRFNLKKYGIGD